MYGKSVLFTRVASVFDSVPRRTKNDSSKKLLDFLAKMPKAHSSRIAEAQRQRQQISKKAEKYAPSTVYLQVLGSGANGAPNTLYMFTDQKRYLFNCGESTQRIAHEHKVKLSRLDHIFITSKTWRNIGGLPGLSLTLQDVGVPNIVLHGPDGLDDLYNATKRFVIMKDMNVTMAKCSPVDDFEDNVMTVNHVLLGPHDSVTLRDLLKEKREKEPKEREVKRPKMEHVDKELEQFIKDDTDYYMHNDIKHRQEQNRCKTPKNWSAEKEKKSIAQEFQDLQQKYTCSVAYICTLKKRLGTLNLERCVELGVKPGPLLGQLKSGHDVILPNGTLVKSKDVKTPDDPGPVFIVLDVPDVAYLKESDFSAHFDDGVNPRENVPTLIVHFTPPHVFHNLQYRLFMSRFGPSTRHLILNSQNSCLGSEAVHRTQQKLHILDTDIFPLLKDVSVPAVWNSQPPLAKTNSPIRKKGLEELRNRIALAQFENIFNKEGSCRGDGAGGGGGAGGASDDDRLEVTAGRAMTIFHLRPKKQLDRSQEPKLHIQDYIQETMDVDGFVQSLEQFRNVVERVRYRQGAAKEYPKVVFLGTGSCIPSKTRNTSAIVLHVNEEKSILLDCGEGTFSQMVRFYGPKKVNGFLRTLRGIYISHLHADHHIGRATVDFQMVSPKGEWLSGISSSHLAYPLNVVPIFRKEMTKNSGITDASNVNNAHRQKDGSNTDHSMHNEVMDGKSSNCSYSLDSGALAKQTDVFKTITLDDRSMQSGFISDDFQIELNFIDSFCKSLQYLESCSSSGENIANTKVENWVRDSGLDVKDAEYDSLFPKISDTNTDSTETIVAKSLCWLNFLIRDEQRRAKNISFLLKMQQHALADFTKSQILWLEDEKKQHNTDISMLKKKQRSALLKLHHECGEMQRMRKVLFTLSEKRKVALLKTKRNIQFMLKNNLNVNEILLKKKIKRNTLPDRNAIPLKCFDLSSSGCDESVLQGVGTTTAVPSAEKSIQTDHSLLEPDLLGNTTETAASQCVTVDGAYLNTLLSNVGLPQIFSCGKQYEVNEEALRNILNSTDKREHYDDNHLETFIDQIKCRDSDQASAPSTARSLVDEFDQYYKGLVDKDKSPKDEDNQEVNLAEVSTAETVESLKPESSFELTTTAGEVSEPIATPANQDTINHCPGSRNEAQTQIQGMDLSPRRQESEMTDVQAMDVNVDSVTMGMRSVKTEDTPCVPPLPKGDKSSATLITPGESDETTTLLSSMAPNSMLSTSNSLTVSAVTKPLIASAPVLIEAEQLRRQQLVIEREIKAIEQQQNQLLVVREIPDKPPPPYTPPVDDRTLKQRKFAIDNTIEQRIREHILTDTEAIDAVDTFVKDFCLETFQNIRKDHDDKPWNACNLLPPQIQLDLEKLVNKTASKLNDVVTTVPTPMPVGGMAVMGGGGGARRSDHVDEILFTEWRRCEPGWTALYVDEADVKNQLFETNFQRIFTETIEEYKRTVLSQRDLK